MHKMYVCIYIYIQYIYMALLLAKLFRNHHSQVDCPTIDKLFVEQILGRFSEDFPVKLSTLHHSL